MCVCERECVLQCVCVRQRERERKRESVCLSVCVRKLYHPLSLGGSTVTVFMVAGQLNSHNPHPTPPHTLTHTHTCEDTHTPAYAVNLLCVLSMSTHNILRLRSNLVFMAKHATAPCLRRAGSRNGILPGQKKKKLQTFSSQVLSARFLQHQTAITQGDLRMLTQSPALS